jgi:hypothetical protein
MKQAKTTTTAKNASLTFEAFQDGINLKLEYAIKRQTSENICGNILNQLFRWVSLQRTVGAEGLKLSQPINLRFEIAGNNFNTALLRKSLQQKLKLQNTSAGRQLYAKRVWAILDYVTSAENNKAIEVKKGQFEAFIESL